MNLTRKIQSMAKVHEQNERSVTTYIYEVTYKQGGKQTWGTVRASDQLSAVIAMVNAAGDLTPVSVSRVGN